MFVLSDSGQPVTERGELVGGCSGGTMPEVRRFVDVVGVKGMESEGEEAEARLGWVWRGWG